MRCQHKSGWKLHPDKVDHDEMRRERERERGGNLPNGRPTMFTLDDDKIMQDAKLERPFFPSFFSATEQAACIY